jgi:mycoredoxin
MDTAITMYTTTWCGYCIRLKSQLRAAGIAFREIDIESDESAARLVEQINGGNRTVPTVVTPSGLALANPSLHEVRAATR